MKLLTLKEIIHRSNIKHNYIYNYDKTLFVNTRTNIIVTCLIHGDFEQLPLNHIKGHECPDCSGKRKLTDESFIQKARAIHGNKYDYSKTMYVNSYTKVIIICPIHGEFEQIPTAHLSGQGCSKCVGLFKLSLEEFINKARAIHGDRYDYSKVVYINNKTKVIIICPIHGEFVQTPNSHLLGSGCPNCKRETLSVFLTYDKEQFIQKARTIHGDKYDYSKVVYINCNIKVIIVCPIHGEFVQTPVNHLQGQGCTKCGRVSISNKLRSNLKEFIEKAIAIHGYRYDYSESDYINNKYKIKIKCPVHGFFFQTVNNHLNGIGCPRCCESKGEKIIADILNKNNIKYIREYKIPNTTYKFRYDFYIPEYDMLIEFQGRQHYYPISVFGGEEAFKALRERDIFKRELASLAKYKLHYFNYKQLKLSNNEFEKLLIEQLFQPKENL